MTYPLVAQEAEKSYEDDHPGCYAWDAGAVRMPIMVEMAKEPAPVERAPELKKVQGYGNGTCVPYARARTGIKLYGWAGSFLKQAEKAGYTVTEVPMEGAILVTNESGGHVAVVEKVEEDGILVSEQNYAGLYQVTRRKLAFEDPVILGYIR